MQSNSLVVLSIALAISTTCTARADDRISLDGTSILYNGSTPHDDGDTGAKRDTNLFRELLRANLNVSNVMLSGDFHNTSVALDVAHVIEEFDLNTEIVDDCSNACIYMFVAGKQRAMAEGVRMGLRRRIVDADYLRSVYPKDKLDYGWEDEFGQAAVMYDLGQSDMRWALLHLMEHGVTLDFALKIFATPREDIWWPARDEMVTGGVIEQ
jgi:hypothetical protein